MVSRSRKLGLMLAPVCACSQSDDVHQSGGNDIRQRGKRENGQIWKVDIPKRHSVEVSPGPESSEEPLFTRRAESVLLQFQRGGFMAGWALLLLFFLFSVRKIQVSDSVETLDSSELGATDKDLWKPIQ